MEKIICIAVATVAAINISMADSPPVLYYFDKPAQIWEETIPLGNGRIGMMPYGDIDSERIILNEITMWSGGPYEADNPESHSYLDQIRGLLFEGRNREAQDLMYGTFRCLGPGSGDQSVYGTYQYFGELLIDFDYGDRSDDPVSDYRRELSISDAVSTNTFTRGGITYTRQFFTSFPDDVGIIMLTADRPGTISLSAGFDRKENFETGVDNGALHIHGQLPDNASGNGMRYSGRAVIHHRQGTSVVGDGSISVNNADTVFIVVSMATDYFGGDPEMESLRLMDRTGDSLKGYSALIDGHTRRFKEKFDRVNIALERNGNSELPIDRRLEAYETDKTDCDLIATYVQFGRYLLICSAREGNLPPNLQGLWANDVDCPWNGDYHLNINLQMNLWPAEACNIAEAQRTLIDYTKSLVRPGSRTARIFYGCEGWVTHILGNVWGFTSVSENPEWGATNTAGAWLCEHLWEHYLFDPDTEYLAEIYPTMKGAALFFEQMLVEDPRNGYLVTAPTTSPENGFISPDGSRVAICAGSAMDNQIIRELFTNVAAGAAILGVDGEWIAGLEEKKSRLAPNMIGRHGQVMEWLEDYEEAEPHHRHVSQLYGLYPGSEITRTKTPELIDAARVTLERRGDHSTGWSMAWKICFWARLGDGDRALKLISDLLKPARTSGGTYPNLFSSHPPMQIDGNFGGTAGIAEMLVQSHDGFIELLPALPSAWLNGSVGGLRVRGGGEICVEWKDGKVVTAKLTATHNGKFRIMLGNGLRIMLKEGDYSILDNIAEVILSKGESVEISADK